MSPLYVSALVDEEPAGSLGAGLAGEPLTVLRCGGVAAVTGEQAAAPSPSPAALARHDEVVRRLAESAPAVLPARFG
ncbi:MAG TPA: GvpL/GvpF family gas vesicle protein, partial [Thermoanaerobaculia bacterium]|nr:GvpL/GvpF family gas vesicle protein [Thermoanaerobaculia bacterium]